MSQKDNARILVVDDNEISRLVTMETLLACGFSVDGADGADQALESFALNTYDLIFMDQEMPGVDGFACMKLIRGQEQKMSASRPTPAILLTANEDPSLTHDMGDFHSYLRKPLNHNQIQVVMKELRLLVPDDLASVSAQDNISYEDSQWLDSFKQIPMIDANAGISHTGTFSLLKRVVDCFSKDLPRELSEFRKSLAENDVESLRIRAHALKHSAYLVGALDLSVEAKRAEQLAKENKIPQLQGFLPEMLKHYEQLEAELEKVMKSNRHEPTKGSLPLGEYRRALNDIHELVEAYDYEDGRLICDMLRDYALSEEQLVFIDHLYDAFWRANPVELLELLNTEIEGFHG